MAMTDRRFVFAWCALLLALSATPVMAEEYWWYRYGRAHHGPQWHAIQSGIYGLNNRIAFLEADPEIDDGYKGPIITRNRAEIRRLQATLAPPRWIWNAPCCYGRRPIHIP
jgi:hypothetical protein